jgi:hypothetical protein
MVRIAVLALVIGGTLAVGPAAAQFGSIFGDNPPPRPPGDIPNFPPQPAPVQQYPDPAPAYPSQQPYPGQPYPGQRYPAAPPPAAAIEARPLPPPPGASAVAPARPNQPYPQQPYPQQPGPPQRAVAAPPAGASPTPPGPPAANSPTPPAVAETPPDDTVVEAPTPHIENGRAVFAGLDKITGRTFTFNAAIGETVRFGALEVTPRACYTRPPTEATNTDAFVEVDEVTLQREIKRIFTGWMFASSPGLNAVEHPVYDVWLTDCADPAQTALADPAPTPAAPQPAPARPVARPAPRAAPSVQAQPR